MVGAGGIWAEVLTTRFLALPAGPTITRALDSLAIAPILRGARGQGPLDAGGGRRDPPVGGASSMPTPAWRGRT